MIEVLAAASRFLATAGAAILLGSSLFWLVCLREPRPSSWPGAVGLPRCALLATLLSHAGLLIAYLLGLREIGSDPQAWTELVGATHVGRVWAWRLLPLGLLLLVLLAPGTARSRRVSAAAALLAAIYLALGVWGGHAAAAESPWQILPPNLLHVLAIAGWMGALPAWLIVVRAYARAHPASLSASELAVALERFSRLAMLLMLLMVATGTWLADAYVETAGDLLGTRYGLLLIAKLLLLGAVLWLANGLRTRFLPTLRSAPRDAAGWALRHAGLECLLAFGILGCASWLVQTTPALHEPSPRWWLPFRWSIDATWGQDAVLRGWVFAGLLVGLIAIAGLVLDRRRQARVASAGLLVLASAALAWALAVPAYPDTYRRSQVPYLSLSVAQGRALYNEHCTACHGAGGLGDGPLASTLPKPPANLSEPHTALHTVGDMHWWLQHGIPQSGMPGFGDRLSEEDRWDLINFLRAFSQGFESRILSDAVVPGQAWLGSINFYMQAPGARPELKAYRGTHNLLLVFVGAEHAAARLDALAAHHADLQQRRTEVLVVPLGEVAPSPALPFVVLASDAAEIWSAYELLSRTVTDRGRADRLGMDWQQAEFLIDRFGYVRARWIAQEQAPGWSDPAALYAGLEQLNREPQLRPPPDDHIH